MFNNAKPFIVHGLIRIPGHNLQLGLSIALVFLSNLKYARANTRTFCVYNIFEEKSSAYLKSLKQ